MKLRPYHNPENVDESKVPDGWRFRYADEMQSRAKTFCRSWLIWTNDFSHVESYDGINLCYTYIVPVA